MSTLANHAFIKMNGLGNEIVVVDMRGQAGAITAAEARAAAQPDGAPYDQLMTLHTARTPGTDAMSASTTTTARRLARAATACAASPIVVRGDRQARVDVRDQAGLLACWKDAEPQVSTVDMGAAVCLARDPAGRGNRRYPRASTADRAGRSTDPARASAVSMGNPHAIFWVDDVNAYDLAKLGPLLEHHPIFPERANISLAQVRRASTSCCAPGSAAPASPGRADRPPARRRSPRRACSAPAAR
jgi:diaminopimelate epimerase